jgi:hypothetical protein
MKLREISRGDKGKAYLGFVDRRSWHFQKLVRETPVKVAAPSVHETSNSAASGSKCGYPREPSRDLLRKRAFPNDVGCRYHDLSMLSRMSDPFDAVMPDRQP